jgi:hypothetical protein
MAGGPRAPFTTSRFYPPAIVTCTPHGGRAWTLQLERRHQALTAFTVTFRLRGAARFGLHVTAYVPGLSDRPRKSLVPLSMPLTENAHELSTATASSVPFAPMRSRGREWRRRRRSGAAGSLPCSSPVSPSRAADHSWRSQRDCRRGRGRRGGRRGDDRASPSARREAVASAVAIEQRREGRRGDRTGPLQRQLSTRRRALSRSTITTVEHQHR